MPLLDVNDLTTYFHTRNGVVRAVDGVSFQLEKGETLGIVGESGSGKSVTCMSMLGLIPKPPGRIEKGTANFDGTDLLHCSQKELQTIRGRRVAMIFQDPMTSLNPYLRIEDQLIEPLLPWRKPRIPGLYVPECPLEFHQAPYGKRIPMLLRRNLFQLSQGALPVTAVIKQVTEKNTCLIEIGI